MGRGATTPLIKRNTTLVFSTFSDNRSINLENINMDSTQQPTREKTDVLERPSSAAENNTTEDGIAAQGSHLSVQKDVKENGHREEHFHEEKAALRSALRMGHYDEDAQEAIFESIEKKFESTLASSRAAINAINEERQAELKRVHHRVEQMVKEIFTANQLVKEVVRDPKVLELQGQLSKALDSEKATASLYAKSSNENAQMRRELDELKEAIKAKDLKLVKYQQDATELHGYKKAYDQMVQERDDSTKKLEQVQLELNDRDAELQDARAEIERLKNEYAGPGGDRLKQELAAKRAEVNNYRFTISKLKEENAQLRQQAHAGDADKAPADEPQALGTDDQADAQRSQKRQYKGPITISVPEEEALQQSYDRDALSWATKQASAATKKPESFPALSPSPNSKVPQKQEALPYRIVPPKNKKKNKGGKKGEEDGEK